MPEKLLTIKEVAQYLRVSEEEVKRLVDMGEIPAYKIGGSFLRFRKEQLDAVKTEISAIEAEPERVKMEPVIDAKDKSTRPYTESKQHDYTSGEKLRDFFYFNDFYILSFLIIAILLYFIFRT